MTPSKIMHPVANEKFCIWGESYESDDELWLYDYQSGQLECISLVTVVELLCLEGLLLSSSNYNLFSKIEAFGDLSESLFTL